MNITDIDDMDRKVLSRLQALCSRREYCSSDILAKALDALDGDADAASEVLEALVEEKYVDDLRYATAFARDKSSLQGWGPYKIRQALSTKKIQPGTIAEALGSIDPDKSSDRLKKLLAVKSKSFSGDPQAHAKLIRFALSRGFGMDEILDALQPGNDNTR